MTASSLLFSMRGVHRLVGHSGLYEGEDLWAELMGAEIVTVDQQALLRCDRARKLYRLARQLHLPRQTQAILSALPPLAPDRQRKRNLQSKQKHHQLFLAVFNNPSELFLLNGIGDWKSYCEYSVCYINEFWLRHLQANFSYLLDYLNQFDRVFIGMHHCVPAIAQRIDPPCQFLPMGVDSLRFFPREAIAPRMNSRSDFRSIDLCNIGRRSTVTHQALLRWAEARDYFYYYDTFSPSNPSAGPSQNRGGSFFVENPQEHRKLFANILKRSRYFIVNCAMASNPEQRRQSELPGRLFEGVASGAILLGDVANSPAFQAYFDWPDAVIPMPFDSPGAADLLNELEQQPERLGRIRQTNVTQALLKHDWLYRLQVIYQSLGLELTERLQMRQAFLQDLAQQWGGQSVPPESPGFTPVNFTTATHNSYNE